MANLSDDAPTNVLDNGLVVGYSDVAEEDHLTLCGEEGDWVISVVDPERLTVVLIPLICNWVNGQWFHLISLIIK